MSVNFTRSARSAIYQLLVIRSAECDQQSIRSAEWVDQPDMIIF